MKYMFFYDETEHSRKINYETVTANNYYDNFITGIVGWKAEDDECISDRYLAFESKYDYRKKDGELKRSVQESLFRHEITRNKILCPKRPETHSGRILVIVSEMPGTFRQVALQKRQPYTIPPESTPIQPARH